MPACSVRMIAARPGRLLATVFGSVLPSMRNWNLPPGLPTTGWRANTVAHSFTGCPAFAGTADEPITVTVPVHGVGTYPGRLLAQSGTAAAELEQLYSPLHASSPTRRA